jgi:hypothetical protein
MNHLPLVAHFNSPALMRAPLPFLSGLLRMSLNLSAAVSFLWGAYSVWGGGIGVSPSAGGKSWIDQDDLI